MSVFLLVTGSREWDRPDFAATALESFEARHIARPKTLIHGGAKGADTLFARLVSGRAGWTTLPPFRPDYEKYSPSEAPLIRNVKMCDRLAEAFGEGHQIECIALQKDHSWGTDHTIRKVAERAGIQARIYYDCACHSMLGNPRTAA